MTSITYAPNCRTWARSPHSATSRATRTCRASSSALSNGFGNSPAMSFRHKTTKSRKMNSTAPFSTAGGTSPQVYGEFTKPSVKVEGVLPKMSDSHRRSAPISWALDTCAAAPHTSGYASARCKHQSLKILAHLIRQNRSS